MIVLSATQSLSPAIERTRRLLFQPFRWQTFLKLCAVALITEGLGGNFNFSGPSHSPAHGSTDSSIPTGPAFSLSPEWIAIIAGLVVASLVIGFALFYLITHLRFALFYCLTYQVKELRPGWRLYREPANRFFWLYVAIALVFLSLVILSVAPFVLEFIRIYQTTQAGAHLNILLLLSLVFPLIAILLVIALVGVSVDIVLRDFMLPHFALEDSSTGAAWREVRARIAAEKGAFFLYAVLRILLPIAAMIALIIVLAIPMVLVIGAGFLLLAAAHGIAADGTLGTSILSGVLAALIGAVIFALGMLVAICFGGPLCIGVRNYALTFYGGRYPLLGNVLFPPAPPPIYAAGETPSL